MSAASPGARPATLARMEAPDVSSGCEPRTPSMNLRSCRAVYQLACPASRGAPRASLPSPDRPWQTAQAA